MKKKYVKPEATREELQKMLDEANEELKALFANLSHDLRAPLSVIAGAAEVLALDVEPGSEAAEMTELIAGRAALMQSIIEDMFFLAGLGSESGAHDLCEVEMRPFLEDYFYSLKADGNWHGRDLVMDIPDNFNASALMDPDLITRVLDNLFVNAGKYSGDGAGITLRASENDAAEEVIIEVSDTGIGIEPEDLPHIFERTFRAKRERPPGDSSSGLGLSIAKEIVENSGGRIWCESVPGKGSTFYFTLRKKGPEVTD